MLRERSRQASKERPAARPAAPRSPARPSKLSYKELQELQELPTRIAGLEAEQAELGERLADPDLYRSDATAVKTLRARYGEIEEQLLRLLERWELLEAKSK